MTEAGTGMGVSVRERGVKGSVRASLPFPASAIHGQLIDKNNRQTHRLHQKPWHRISGAPSVTSRRRYTLTSFFPTTSFKIVFLFPPLITWFILRTLVHGKEGGEA